MNNIYAYIIAGLLVIGIGLGIHHAGAVDGRKEGQSIADQAHVAQIKAEAAASSCAGALTAADMETQAAKMNADKQLAQAAQLFKQAATDQIAAETSARDWKAKFTKAVATASCKTTAEAHLCKELQDY